MRWSFEEGCESESRPGCPASIARKLREEELGFCQSLEMKFHVKINYKNLVGWSYSCLWWPSKVPQQSCADEAAWQVQRTAESFGRAEAEKWCNVDLNPFPDSFLEVVWAEAKEMVTALGECSEGCALGIARMWISEVTWCFQNSALDRHHSSLTESFSPIW